MSLRRRVALLSLFFAPLACGSVAGSAGSTALNAAVGTGMAVAAAGINRAITHECWAVCRPGLLCDRATGLCVEALAARKPTPPQSGATDALEANPPGHEYEVGPLSACTEDAGPCANATADAQAP